MTMEIKNQSPGFNDFFFLYTYRYLPKKIIIEMPFYNTLLRLKKIDWAVLEILPFVKSIKKNLGKNDKEF